MLAEHLKLNSFHDWQNGQFLHPQFTSRLHISRSSKSPNYPRNCWTFLHRNCQHAKPFALTGNNDNDYRWEPQWEHLSELWRARSLKVGERRDWPRQGPGNVKVSGSPTVQSQGKVSGDSKIKLEMQKILTDTASSQYPLSYLISD